jgi:hypothetical protein
VASVVEVSGELAGCFDAGGAAAADDDAFGCGEFGVDRCESCGGVCVGTVEGKEVGVRGGAGCDDQSVVRNCLRLGRV